MEIKLPPYTAYLDKIVSGRITVIRVPLMPVKPGYHIKAIVPGSSSGFLLLGVNSITHVPLTSITVEEADAEGFCLPDFCPTMDICRNIERRLEGESQSETLSALGSNIIERQLDRKLINGCKDCIIKRDARALFLDWWQATYQSLDINPITKIEFEVLSKSIQR